MARTFGKLLCTIWTDDDFLALTPNAKVLYSAFISQVDISPAGILPFTERRWRKWVDGTTKSVTEALDELIDKGFVLADDDTAEVWIRSFIRHDGRLENSKLAASVRSSIDNIRSETIAEALSCGYPNITPRRRPFDGPSEKQGRPIEPPSDVTDLDHDHEQDLPPLPEPAVVSLTVEEIANEAGRIHAQTEINAGRGRSIDGLRKHKTSELVKDNRAHLERLVERNRRYLERTGTPIPTSVLAAAALGDGHSLVHYPADAPAEPADEPGPKLSPDRIQALIKPTEET